MYSLIGAENILGNYIEAMMQRALDSFDQVFDGVERIRLVDFPDHPNVGDSAIALGELAYFSKRGIIVDEIQCIGTFRAEILRSREPVVMHGGGNIAGFFAGIDDHRNNIGHHLDPATLLIQAPQSIHFKSEHARQQFTEAFSGRSKFRLAVRELEAIAVLNGIHDDPILAPDAVHILGRIDAPPPTQEFVVLKRQDRESAATTTHVPTGFDWPSDTGLLAMGASLRWKAKYFGKFGEALNLSPDRWERAASRRLLRGIDLLSPGECVVTDRLHAMLLALQMGRRVVAIDNNNRKLSKYADTWFKDMEVDVTFAPNFETALDLV